VPTYGEPNLHAQRCFSRSVSTGSSAIAIRARAGDRRAFPDRHVSSVDRIKASKRAPLRPRRSRRSSRMTADGIEIRGYADVHHALRPACRRADDLARLASLPLTCPRPRLLGAPPSGGRAAESPQRAPAAQSVRILRTRFEIGRRSAAAIRSTTSSTSGSTRAEIESRVRLCCFVAMPPLWTTPT
jgi:hypothetical protein